MSATDSDNSIDWLASDCEDDESEQELDSSRKHSQTEAPPSPGNPPARLRPTDDGGCRRGSEGKDRDNSWEVREASGRGSPPNGKEIWDSTVGLYKRQQAEREKGKTTQQTLKRKSSSAEEERNGRQLLPNGSEKNQIFSRKCVELQCYVHPLSSILNGLRSGRYRQRLSSFQESVAMDRIQRIMGVLQNPCMGEKYVNIIMKMEEMLKSWFPNVKVPDQLPATKTEEEFHTKKRKLSPVPTAAATPPPLGDPPARVEAPRAADLTPPASNLKWLHTSPSCPPTAEQAPAGPRHLLSHRDLTQDNVVSSSTDGHTKTDSVPRGPPPPGKINAPCLERLLKSTDSIITRMGTGGLMDSSWS
ncbi:circadian-associated transcriptional repressor [Brachionichthys hirsutus]|uniref:circadian-associated transcriptional repressor n=1 Tax=Brachionichthys hirsutus TaxID=412623 RepID=UPI0036053E74